MSRQAEAGDWTGSRGPGRNEPTHSTADLAVKLRPAAGNQQMVDKFSAGDKRRKNYCNCLPTCFKIASLRCLLHMPKVSRSPIFSKPARHQIPLKVSRWTTSRTCLTFCFGRATRESPMTDFANVTHHQPKTKSNRQFFFYVFPQ